MKIKWFVILVSLGFVFLLTACNGRRGLVATDYPECDPNTLIPPALVSPQNGSITASLQPMLEWASPGYSNSNDLQEVRQLCSTSGFNIYLSSGPFFQDDLGGQTGGVPAMNSPYTRTWTPGTPLEPAREYRWSIRPISQGMEGPASEVNTFFTGPSCESGSLSAPIPVSPLNHWVVGDPADLKLSWTYPDGCVPDSYNVEISPIMLFDGSPLNGNTGIPTTSWVPTHILEDCTPYYWRVKAVKDGQTGQGSQVYTFRVDLTGTCAPLTTGSIQGTVWEDQCGGPGAGTPMPDPLPLGCALTSSNTLFTNQAYDPGEPGIPGLVVNLGLGACPSTGLRAVPTWQDGMFNFYMIAPGTYCVSVDTKDPMSGPILLPGNWTVPADAIGFALANQTVTVSAGQDIKSVDFGWWYKYGTGWGSTNATVFGLVWHDMCAYTPGDPIPDPLPAGCIIDQWGNVHADAVHQSDEPGIAGVVVDIGPGDCPSAGLAAAVTDANGYYVFNEMAAGKYCLRIDPAHDSSNESILMPGSWTVIPSGHEGMTFRAISLVANHTLPGQDFGWDYDDLPLTPTPTPTSTLTPTSTSTPTPAELTFTPNINAYCRYGADKSFFSDEIAMKGTPYLMDGRNLANTWYRIMINPTKGCWVPASSGTPSGDPLRLRVLFELPTYTPTLVPSNTPIVVVNCARFTDEKSCEAQPACMWSVPATGALGICVKK